MTESGAMARAAAFLHRWLLCRADVLAGALEDPKPSRPIWTGPLPRALAHNAALRAAARENLRLTRRFRHLADVAETAPWIGVMGTVIGMSNSFVLIPGPRSAYLAVLFGHFAEILLPLASGLGISVVAYCLRAHMTDCTYALRLEMETAAGVFTPPARAR